MYEFPFRAKKAVTMSAKIFNNFFPKNLKNSYQFRLHPPHRTVEKNVLFTRKGDTGKTNIYNGELSKDHKIMEAVGATEELNAHIGLAREFVKDDEKLIPLEEKLRKIQLVLIDVIEIINSLQPDGNLVDKTKPPDPPTTAKIADSDISGLEVLIDHYSTFLPPVEKIIIPGGGKASASLYLAKAVCRRCERILVHIFKDINDEKNLLAYINRLSSFLSQAARISTKFASRAETVYKPQLKEDLNAEDK